MKTDSYLKEARGQLRIAMNEHITVNERKKACRLSLAKLLNGLSEGTYEGENVTKFKKLLAFGKKTCLHEHVIEFDPDDDPSTRRFKLLDIED